MKLWSDYRVQVSKRVHVSRIVLTPFNVTVDFLRPDDVSPTRWYARTILLIRNSRHRTLYVHLILSDANDSLLSPRHRCYALLSSAMSGLVRETSCNSYQPCQDGLW